MSPSPIVVKEPGVARNSQEVEKRSSRAAPGFHFLVGGWPISRAIWSSPASPCWASLRILFCDLFSTHPNFSKTFLFSWSCCSVASLWLFTLIRKSAGARIRLRFAGGHFDCCVRGDGGISGRRDRGPHALRRHGAGGICDAARVLRAGGAGQAHAPDGASQDGNGNHRHRRWTNRDRRFARRVPA